MWKKLNKRFGKPRRGSPVYAAAGAYDKCHGISKIGIYT